MSLPWQNQVHALRRYWLAVLLSSLFLLPSYSSAEDDAEEGETPTSIYVPIEPAFVTNYGGPGRLRYVKIEVSLRVTGAKGEAQALHHMPNIRDTMLNLFAIQTNESIGSAAGKEALRKQAFDGVTAILQEEDEASYLEDLLFTGFVIHR